MRPHEDICSPFTEVMGVFITKTPYADEAQNQPYSLHCQTYYTPIHFCPFCDRRISR